MTKHKYRPWVIDDFDTFTVRQRCYRSKTTWTYYLRNTWYSILTQITYVTTSLRGMNHRGRHHQTVYRSCGNTVIYNMTDNRMDLQDVPPLSNCTVHHINLTQVNLWKKKQSSRHKNWFLAKNKCWWLRCFWWHNTFIVYYILKGLW